MKTLCSIPNQQYMAKCIHKIHKNKIPGDIVETGVFKGGMMMIAAQTLILLNDYRTLWLYDTYEGMPKPDPIDVKLDGSPMLGNHICNLQTVKQNMLSTGYPQEKLRFVKGKVEHTLKTTRPEQIAILRLDTDFYSSTKASLFHLHSLLQPKGHLLVDDYNCWKGCKQAVDEFFPNKTLTKIDKSAVEISF